MYLVSCLYHWNSTFIQGGGGCRTRQTVGGTKFHLAPSALSSQAKRPPLWKERKHKHLLQSLSNISCFLKKKKKKIAGPFCHFLALRWHHTSYLSLSFFICKPRQLIPPSSVFVRMKERNVSKAYAHCLTQRNGSTVTALTGGDGDGVERSGLWAALGRL